MTTTYTIEPENKNAKAQIKEYATAVIGNNYEDGVALFLRERFSL